MPGSPPQIGALIDTLASPADRLWPSRCWPPMRLDRAPAVGAIGGHGPIRYVVEHFEPGRRIRFRFLAPAGFDGTHELVVVDERTAAPRLRHCLEMKARGWARITWPLLYRPLHDALIEDALACAQQALGASPVLRPWSAWVRLVRWVMSRGRSRSQDSLSLEASGDPSAPRAPGDRYAILRSSPAPGQPGSIQSCKNA